MLFCDEKSRRGRVFGAVLISLFTAGCTGAPLRVIDDRNIDEMVSQFKNGDIVLSDDIDGISRYYGESRGSLLKNLYLTGDWLYLSKIVIQINKDMDICYFYLGRSAEEIGYVKAAKIYYWKAVSTPHKCDGWVDSCDGLQPRQEALARLEALNAMPGQRR